MSWCSLVGMTLSNGCGAFFAVWYARHYRFGTLASRSFLTVLGLVLMALRQNTELRRWREVHVLKRPLKERVE